MSERTWKFRATYAVPPLGILRGDWIYVEEDFTLLIGRERPARHLTSFIPHLGLFDMIEGSSLRNLLLASAAHEGDQGRSSPVDTPDVNEAHRHLTLL